MKIMRWLLLTLLTGGVAVADAQADFATDDERNTIQVFEKARPSVVFVTNQQLVRDPRSLNLLEVPRGSGTGFVWDESGYIVTNFHVVDGARKVMITLQDQSTWPAEIVGLAPERDLAVLKISAPEEHLTALPLGDSSQLSAAKSSQSATPLALMPPSQPALSALWGVRYSLPTSALSPTSSKRMPPLIPAIPAVPYSTPKANLSASTP